MLPQIKKSRKDFLNTFLLVLGYGAFICCFILFLARAGFIQQIPTETTLFHWDSGYYLSIVNNGYISKGHGNDNTGFFILFPLLWRLAHIGVVGICIINYVLFAFGFSLLTSIYKVNTTEKLLWLSVPTVYIMAIPYTESLFFLSMSITFYGIIKTKRWIIWVGLILASLTRATSVFLLPALLVMELIASQRKVWYKVLLSYCLDYVIPIVSALAFFVWYQYYSVGAWFPYVYHQQEYMGHKYSLPILPFTSMEGPRMLWFSALAMFCCLLALIAAIKKGSLWLFKNRTEPDKLLTLSLIFLGITLYKTIFYNPTWSTNTTLTIGISRYAFATPFFYVFLHYFTSRSVPYKLLDFILAIILANAVWFSCGAYLHIQYFLYFNFSTLIIFLYMYFADKSKTWPALVIMGMNSFFLILMFQQYLSGLYLE